MTVDGWQWAGVGCEWVSWSELELDDSELATACSQFTQLPPSFRETFHSTKTFLFLAASQLKAKIMSTFQEDNPFLKYCTIITWRSGFKLYLGNGGYATAGALEVRQMGMGKLADLGKGNWHGLFEPAPSLLKKYYCTSIYTVCALPVHVSNG